MQKDRFYFFLNIRNHKLAHSKNLYFTHPKPPQEDSRLLKALSTKMAWEAGKEPHLNEQNTHNGHNFQAFLLESMSCKLFELSTTGVWEV